MESWVIQELGTYTGKRIANMSFDVMNVILCRRYLYKGHTIYVDNIHAHRDNVTGRIFVPGPLALRINGEVEQIMENIRQWTSATPMSGIQAVLKDIPYTVTIDASNLTAA